MRTHNHQNLDLNRNMQSCKEVKDNINLLSKEGSMSVKHGTVIEVQTERCTRNEMASSHNVIHESGTFCASEKEADRQFLILVVRVLEVLLLYLV